MNILEIRTQHVKHRRLNPDYKVYKGSNSPRLMHDDQIPPHPREGKGRQIPEVCPEGGC